MCRDAGGLYLRSSALVVEGVANVAALEAIEALSLAKDLFFKTLLLHWVQNK